MALRDAILVSLGDGPMSGYDLAKHFDQNIGFFWRATHSQIYRELSKLKDKGFISAEEIPQRGKPNRIVYSVTNEGRDHLLAWSRQPCAPDPVKDDFLARLYGLEHMDVDACGPTSISVAASAYVGNERAPALGVIAKRLAVPSVMRERTRRKISRCIDGKREPAERPS